MNGPERDNNLLTPPAMRPKNRQGIPSLPNDEIARRLAIIHAANAAASRETDRDSPLDVIKTAMRKRSRAALKRVSVHVSIDSDLISLLKSDEQS